MLPNPIFSLPPRLKLYHCLHGTFDSLHWRFLSYLLGLLFGEGDLHGISPLGLLCVVSSCYVLRVNMDIGIGFPVSFSVAVKRSMCLVLMTTRVEVQWTVGRFVTMVTESK